MYLAKLKELRKTTVALLLTEFFVKELFLKKISQMTSEARVNKSRAALSFC